MSGSGNKTFENDLKDESLPAEPDKYGGVQVDMGKEPMEPEVFSSKLRASMSLWKRQGRKGIWIKLPLKLVNLAEIAVQEGFRFHHAEPSYLMLVNWIPEVPCTLPPNASHQVGVGVIVLNDKHEVLVVQENSGPLMGLWKIPTGIVDEGEDIHVAAVRELKEETGVISNDLEIDAEFSEVIAFRHMHKAFNDKSDLFFVCMLRPLSFEVKNQELEIEAAKWMPFEEYAAQPVAQEHFKYITDVCRAKIQGSYSGFSSTPITSNGRSCYAYLNSRDLDKTNNNT